MTGDLWLVVGGTALVVVVVGLLGTWGVRRVRRTSLVTAMVVAALLPFVAVVLSVWMFVGAMFISDHDASVARVVLVASAVPAVVLALLLGRVLLADVRAVSAQARALAHDQPGAATPAAPVTAELAGLADELERTRASLVASRARERALESSRRQIVAFVSHDLRSPLAGITATTSGLRDGVIPATDDAYAGIGAAAARMGRMIDDLAELSRPDGAPPPAPRRVELTGVLRQVMSHVAVAAAAQGVAVDADIAPGLAVDGTPEDLARVLDNLVANAVRSSGPGGRVRVRARPDGDEVRVAVADSCGGIPVEDLDRLFEPGWQGDRHSGAGAGSEGLGLAIVGRVVAAHGGRVDVAPTDDGCLFEVRLPAHAGR